MKRWVCHTYAAPTHLGGGGGGVSDWCHYITVEDIYAIASSLHCWKPLQLPWKQWGRRRLLQACILYKCFKPLPTCFLWNDDWSSHVSWISIVQSHACTQCLVIGMCILLVFNNRDMLLLASVYSYPACTQQTFQHMWKYAPLKPGCGKTD